MFSLRQADLHKLNSLTKYPSILTYHDLGEKGVLLDTIQIQFSGPVIGTEKVDGTNARIVCCPDGGILVGSREDLLWARGDLIGNPAMGIVDGLKSFVEAKADALSRPDRIVVYFVEFYGRSVGAAAKNYSRQGRNGFRLFDHIVLDDFTAMLDWPVEKISLWRDNGGQPFVDVATLSTAADALGLETVPTLFEMDAADLPTTHDAVNEFLLGFGPSRCKLDDEADGTPEGVVVRTPDRKTIAKLRREDYERTLKKRTKKS